MRKCRLTCARWFRKTSRTRHVRQTTSDPNPMSENASTWTAAALGIFSTAQRPAQSHRWSRHQSVGSCTRSVRMSRPSATSRVELSSAQNHQQCHQSKASDTNVRTSRQWLLTPSSFRIRHSSHKSVLCLESRCQWTTQLRSTTLWIDHLQTQTWSAITVVATACHWSKVITQVEISNQSHRIPWVSCWRGSSTIASLHSRSSTAVILTNSKAAISQGRWIYSHTNKFLNNSRIRRLTQVLIRWSETFSSSIASSHQSVGQNCKFCLLCNYCLLSKIFFFSDHASYGTTIVTYWTKTPILHCIIRKSICYVVATKNSSNRTPTSATRWLTGRCWNPATPTSIVKSELKRRVGRETFEHLRATAWQSSRLVRACSSETEEIP